MSAPAANACYTCGEAIEPGCHAYAARFNGTKQHVCKDCAIGIHDGLSVLAMHGVTGEYLGPCGDNDVVPPKS